MPAPARLADLLRRLALRLWDAADRLHPDPDAVYDAWVGDLADWTDDLEDAP